MADADAAVVAPAPGIQDFLDQKNALAETDEAYHRRCQEELDKSAALLRQHHAHRLEQLRAAHDYGSKMAEAARAWAAGLSEGASASHADDDLARAALVRNLDGRLLSLALAGFAEIEYGKEKLRRQAEFNQNLTDTLLYFAERRRHFTEFISRLDHDTNYAVQVRPLPRNDPQFKRCKRAVLDNARQQSHHAGGSEQDDEDIQIQQIYQVRHKKLMARFQRRLRESEGAPQIKGLFCPVSSASVERAITLGLGAADQALSPDDVFRKCWFRVIDEAQQAEQQAEQQAADGGVAASSKSAVSSPQSCAGVVHACDAMPEKLLFSRHSDFGPDDNMTPGNDSRTKYLLLCRVILDNVYSSSGGGGGDAMPTLTPKSKYGAVLNTSTKKYVVRDVGHAALPEFLIQYVSPNELGHRLDPTAQDSAKSYFVPSQAMVSDLYSTATSPSRLDGGVPVAVGGMAAYKTELTAATSSSGDGTGGDGRVGERTRGRASPSSSPVATSPLRGAQPLVLPRRSAVAARMPVAAHVQPHLAVCRPATSAVPNKAVQAVRAEEGRRRRKAARAHTAGGAVGGGGGSGGAGRGAGVVLQGPVCPFPQLSSPDQAIQAGDYAQDDILEGLRANLRKVRSEVKKTVNFTVNAKHDAVRSKQQRQPGGAEPREIAQIKELAQEMTSLREELWLIKSGGGPGGSGGGEGVGSLPGSSHGGGRGALRRGGR